MPHVDKTRLIQAEGKEEEKSVVVLIPPSDESSTDLKSSSELKIHSGKGAVLNDAPTGTTYTKKAVSLLIWFFFNSMTLILNKHLFTNVEFRYPLTLTAIHMATGLFFSSLIIIGLKLIPFQRLPLYDIVAKIFPLSFVFCLNIVLGNISIRWVPISFMQTIKSSVPVFTVILQFLWHRKVFPTKIYIALVPVVGGVALASFSEANFVLVGFLCALFASVLTALQAIVVHILVASGLKKLDPINLVLYTSPISLALLLPSIFMFEMPSITTEWVYYGEWYAIGWLVVSGTVAFCLNYSSFIVSSVVDVLTMTVAGNAKAVINIIASVMIFGNVIGYVNWLGCLVASGGVMWYNHLMLQVKK